jgi:hypothetical protein
MGGVWSIIAKDDNRRIICRIGGGALMAAALVGTLLPGRAGAGDAAASAGDCGIAAGHGAHGDPAACNYGLTGEQLKQLIRAAAAAATEPMQKRIEALSRRLGVTREATMTLLRIVGEQPDSADQDLSKALSKVATDYTNLQAQIAAMSTAGTLARLLAPQAKAEVAAGRLQSARELLQKLNRRVETMGGRCTAIEALGVAIDPKLCLREIMNSEDHDNRVAFTYLTQRDRGVAVISFSGPGPGQIRIDSDDVLLPVDKVVSTYAEISNEVKADGACWFSNPYKGKPSSVWCTATTGEGRFSGAFTSNGIAPGDAGSPAPRSETIDRPAPAAARPYAPEAPPADSPVQAGSVPAAR